MSKTDKNSCKEFKDHKRKAYASKFWNIDVNFKYNHVKFSQEVMKNLSKQIMKLIVNNIHLRIPGQGGLRHHFYQNFMEHKTPTLFLYFRSQG